ncbi:hypothetical protein Tco_0805197 [Tanacetum coccineum]
MATTTIGPPMVVCVIVAWCSGGLDGGIQRCSDGCAVYLRVVYDDSCYGEDTTSRRNPNIKHAAPHSSIPVSSYSHRELIGCGGKGHNRRKCTGKKVMPEDEVQEVDGVDEVAEEDEVQDVDEDYESDEDSACMFV